MAGDAAAAGEDSLGGDHAAQILGAGLDAGEDDLGPLVGELLGPGRREHELPGRGAGAGGEARGQEPAPLLRRLVVVAVEDRGQQLGERVRIRRLDGVLGRHQLLLDHVVGDLHIGQCRPLPVPRLQHVELFLFDGELEVLDVAELLLQRRPDLLQLLVGAGEHGLMGHLGHGLRRPHASHHVLPLGVDEILAVENVLAGGRVTGEGDARGAVVPHVAEHHALDVDRRAPLVGDLVLAAIDDRPLVHPAAEHGAYGTHQLPERLLRERLAGPLLDEPQVAADEFAEVRLGEVGVVVDPELVLQPLHRLLEGVMLVLVPLLHAHHHVAVHLDEAAVGVVGETGVAGGGGEALDGLVVEAEVQDRVHHARHAVAGTRPDADEQGVLRIAELLPRLLLHELHGGGDLLLEALGELLVVLVVVDADLRGDREPGGHRQPDLGHLGEVRPLAAEERLHRAVAVAPLGAEVVDHPSRLAPASRLPGGLLGGLLSEGGGHRLSETFRGGMTTGNPAAASGSAENREKTPRIYVRPGSSSTRAVAGRDRGAGAAIGVVRRLVGTTGRTTPVTGLRPPFGSGQHPPCDLAFDSGEVMVSVRPVGGATPRRLLQLREPSP